jgi:tRNA dimethylallyltransferase
VPVPCHDIIHLMKWEKIRVILGPTAVGKSALALEIAQKIDAEIISADSMQVYRGMDIGTAKPSLTERELVPHYLIDVVKPDEAFSVADFLAGAELAIRKIQSRKKSALIVGGTGLYLKALFDGYNFPTATDPEVRQRVKEEIESSGTEKIHQKLKKIDPTAAGRLHPNDLKRIGRALEVFYQTGRPISAQQEKIKLPYSYEITGLNMSRERLYKKIEARIDEMIEKGLIKEVKKLLAAGYKRDLTSMQALGYKETIDHLDGCYSFDEYVNLLKQRTRNFAKRQMTWFRAFKNVSWQEL